MDPTDRMLLICADINRFFHDYDTISRDGIPGEDDTTRFHALSMVLFTLLNLCFELGEEMIAYRHATLPQSYRDIFRILREQGMIDEKIKENMSRMVYYRNRLAHQYAGLDREDLVSIIDNLGIVREFVSLMKRELQN